MYIYTHIYVCVYFIYIYIFIMLLAQNVRDAKREEVSNSFRKSEVGNLSYTPWASKWSKCYIRAAHTVINIEQELFFVIEVLAPCACQCRHTYNIFFWSCIAIYDCACGPGVGLSGPQRTISVRVRTANSDFFSVLNILSLPLLYWPK